MAKKKRISLQEVSISAYAAEGKSIGHMADGKVVFVENVVPGDVVDLRITKNKKSYAEGKMTRLVSPSPLRIEPFCTHFGVCGGCKWQMLPYEQQLQYKQQQVGEQMRRIGHVSLPEMEQISGSPVQRFYRNKLEFTFSTKRYRTNDEITAAGDEELAPEQGLGFHAPGLFDKVVPIDFCHLQNEPTNRIRNLLRDYTTTHQLPYYDFRAHSGYMRNLMIRVTTTGEVLVNLVLNEDDEASRKPMLDFLLEQVPEISTLCYTINRKWNDSIYDQEVITYHGNGFITERLEDFTFNISPKSFFQTNSYQAEELYRITRDFAGLTGSEVLYDLYCGTGSIGIFCSKNARKIIGIEVVEQAIEDAKINAAQNHIEHALFYAGDVSDICTDEFFKEHGKPDVVITDPPRAGMSEKLVQQLIKMRAPRIVYVSCNPATQARDLALLTGTYSIKRMRPVDMFPHTHHIENVVLLELNEELIVNNA
ncbi:MAG: 23S rRNA (uracil(1939)-C(5))-methyltransferase RlmD [Chitinophagaceae bacterium]|nr:23S rRNA (uracil(1939)-C(5))-methyltransferase RlmD [Chitinophagaceae bacterium]